MKSFEYEATVKSFLPDIFGASVFFLYAIFSTRIPFDTFYSSLKFFISVVIFMQFGCAIITDHLCYHKISTRVKSFYTSKTTISERTHLFDELIQSVLHSIDDLLLFLHWICSNRLLFLFIPGASTQHNRSLRHRGTFRFIFCFNHRLYFLLKNCK